MGKKNKGCERVTKRKGNKRKYPAPEIKYKYIRLDSAIEITSLYTLYKKHITGRITRVFIFLNARMMTEVIIKKKLVPYFHKIQKFTYISLCL